MNEYELNKKIIKLYNEGNRIIDISHIIHKSNRYISQVLKTNNIKIKYSTFKDLSGKTINNWKIIDRNKSKNNGTYWNCICLYCHNTYSVLGENITSGLSKNCVNCGRLKIRKGYRELSGSKWSDIKRTAYKKNLDFNITKKYIWELYEKQNYKCALTGVHITLGYDRKDTASLDRIDSKKGYIMNNVWWVHKTVNQIKWTLDVNELLEWCKKILDYSL